MAGRPKKFVEEEVIEKAGELFWKKGYEATSTEELLEVMGIGKGSFYLHFKEGKKELYEKTLQYYAENSIRKLIKDLTTAEDKLDVVKARFFNRLADVSFKDKGCYIGNALVEMANYDNDLKNRAASLLNRLEGIFYEVLVEAQEKQRISTKQSPRFLAKYLINLWNGMNITRRMGGDETILKQVVEKNLEILS